MEQQIKVEKDRVMAEERARERQLRDELERAVHEKDAQLNELLSTHTEIQRKLQNLNSQEFESKQENEKLLQEKNDLEDMLNSSQHNLDDSRSYISELRQQYRKEKKDRAMAAMQISEGIALERESLVKQLDLLRDMNKKLRDDHDEAELRRQNSNLQQELSEAMLNGELKSALAHNEESSTPNDSDVSRDKNQADGAPVKEEVVARQQSVTSRRKGAQLEKQGSIMSNYFNPEPPRDGSLNALDSDDDIECDDPIMMTNHSTVTSPLANGYAGNMTLASDFSQPKREYLTNLESYRGAVSASAGHSASGASLSMSAGLSQQEYLAHATRDDSFKQANPKQADLSLADETDQLQGAYLDSVDSQRGADPNSANHREALLALAAQSGESITNPSHDLSFGAENRISQRDYSSTSLHAASGPLSNADGAVCGDFDIQSPRGVPVGANSSTDPAEYNARQKEVEAASPERLFKVVFVGDSGVGKSSFIHQFCSHSFKATFSATIGVDFQVKNMKVDGHIIALQLWDTAGQERFRSITKQYFRKADGVLVMYDVTSELSYKNVRNWMTSVQEGAGDNVVIAIAGNKIDLVEDEDGRVVTMKDGSKLADEFGALFYEVSAKTGISVKETLEGMASLLREREDEEMEKALHLTESEDVKKKCCG